MKINGALKLWLMIGGVLVASGIAWGLLSGKVAECDKRMDRIEKHADDGAVHEPNNIKSYRIDSRMQGFYDKTIKPDLARMEQRIMLAIQKLEERVK